MDGQIIELVKAVGFPVAMALLLYLTINKQLKENTDSLTELRIAIVELRVMLNELSHKLRK